MQKKHRIIVILVVGALVGSLVIGVSLCARDGVTTDMSLQDRLRGEGKKLLVKLGLRDPPPRAQCCACIANLKQIDGAKATWALEEKKTNTEIPTFTEYYTNAFIGDEPTLPAGGKHTAESVEAKPSSSFPGHTH